MIKIPVEEFIQEVKEEIAGYEEMGGNAADGWEKGFRKMLDKGILSDGLIKQEQGSVYISLKDESELFELADTYWIALENEEEDKYWEGLK